jgi:uncharacterized protein (DUF58 family)
VEGLPRTIELLPGTAAEFSYRVRAVRRGEARFAPAEILRRSVLGLWLRRERSGEASSVRIYPNFAAVAGFTLHAMEGRLQLMGIRRKRRRGEGFDFRQLRDFQLGDTLRQVDWKATSRRQRPISREYQEERDQQILFLVDCGRRMRAMDGELAHFDHCLNAVLLVAYLALRQGDRGVADDLRRSRSLAAAGQGQEQHADAAQRRVRPRDRRSSRPISSKPRRASSRASAGARW